MKISNEMNREELIQQIIKNIQNMPPKLQSAQLWAIRNFDEIKMFVSNQDITVEELEHLIQKFGREEAYQAQIIAANKLLMVKEDQQNKDE